MGIIGFHNLMSKIKLLLTVATALSTTETLTKATQQTSRRCLTAFMIKDCQNFRSEVNGTKRIRNSVSPTHLPIPGVLLTLVPSPVRVLLKVPNLRVLAAVVRVLRSPDRLGLDLRDLLLVASLKA